MDEKKLAIRMFVQFTIRDWLSATALLTACVGWWQDSGERDTLAVPVESLELDLRLTTIAFAYDSEAKEVLPKKSATAFARAGFKTFSGR